MTLHGMTMLGTAANMSEIASAKIRIENNLVMASSHQSAKGEIQ